MSAVGYVARLREEQPARRGLSGDARTFLVSTVGAALAATAALSLSFGHSRVSWWDFAVVAAGGAVAQLFATPLGGNQLFHTGLAWTVAAALLLPPELVVLVCLLQHIPDWARHRTRWYVQTFNIANFALAGLAAWGVRAGLGGLGYGVGGHVRASTVFVAAAAAAGFVLVNHLLLAEMLYLARARSFRESGIFGLESLVTDGVLAATGGLLGIALLHAPALTALAAAPLLLMHRTLVVPALREQADRDFKTGLLNARGFERCANDEFGRAQRFSRSLSVLLCDVDDLRGVNARHGHLKGDEALRAVADGLRDELRSFDLCARVGGDEFVVVLPETTHEQAVAVGARIREWLASHPLSSRDGELEIAVSIGAATASEADEALGHVIARADAAMYAAKATVRADLVAVG